MGKFVNRDEELTLVEDALDTLSDRRRLLRTPVIEFYGIDGIGKTTLLKKVQEKCKSKPLRCIWEDQSTSYRSVTAPSVLLNEKEPVVVLLDSLDEANEEQMPQIEEGLRDLTENSNLFFVLASRKLERFDNTRALMRKLTVVPLKPLNRDSCEEYFDSMERNLKPEIRNAIYEWTRGYPLAMDVMVQAIVDKDLDPTKEQNKRQLISILAKTVIDKNILSHSGNNYLGDQIFLSLLSVPRRFNLAIMQDIIEQFAPPDYHLPSSLAYMTLPDRINQVTNALSWSMRRGGYRIDEPIRNIFLLQLRIAQPQQFVNINRFLAQLNERLAKEVSGPDRSRYLREYFYHLANSGEVANLAAILDEHIKQLLQPDDSFIQFYEEFLRDDELQEALGGKNTRAVLSLIHGHLAKRYRVLAEESSELDQADYLRNFLFHTAHDPEVKDFPLLFEQEMRRIRQEVSPGIYKQLVDELSQDEEFKSLLEKGFDSFSQQG